MSRNMNPRQAQIIDPILSNVARGYTNAEFIGSRLFPVVGIPARSMKVIRFGKDAFRRYIDSRRAPGSATRRIQFGYESDPVSLKQEALEAQVPIEIAQSAERVPGIDMASVSIKGVQDIIGLGREIEQAGLARNDALYHADNKATLSGSSQWSDQASKPASDVQGGRESVRRRIGRYPNVLALGPAAFNALCNHEKIAEKFKYTSSDSITEAMLAKYFGLDEVVVGKAVALAEDAKDDDPAIDVWGNDAVLAYVPRGTNFLVPSYGYTYNLDGYPAVEQPYYERNTKSWIYPVTEEFRPYLVGAEAGFLFKNAAVGVM